jgi:D-sedoheptulose 7-phosphate isomerase
MIKSLISDEINEHINLVVSLKEELPKLIEQASLKILNAIESKNKIILFGNGGSAADAQHIAAEFTGRFVIERRGLPAISLTTDTSAITAIGNDYGFEEIFKRQVEALANRGDVLIGISTSGNSENVLKGLEEGKKIGCYTIAITGNIGGLLKSVCDLNINIPFNVTARIQEMHIMVGHLICSYIDKTILINNQNQKISK